MGYLAIIATIVVIFLFVGWKQFKDILKAESIFDILFISGLGSLLIGRLIGFLLNINYYFSFGWSVSSFSSGLNQSSGNYMPWNFFNFFDGNYSYTGILIGFVFMINLLFVNSNQKKSIYILLDKIFVAIVFSLLAYSSLMTVIDYTWFNQNLFFFLIVAVLSLFIMFGAEKVNGGYLSIVIYGGFALLIIVNDLFSKSERMNFEVFIAFALLLFGIIQLLALRYKHNSIVTGSEINYRESQQIRRQGKLTRRNEIGVTRVDRVTQKLGVIEKIKLIIQGEKRKRK